MIVDRGSNFKWPSHGGGKPSFIIKFQLTKQIRLEE